MIIEKNKVIH